MTFILLPGAVAIHGSDSVSMKREASAPIDDACAMVSSSDKSTRSAYAPGTRRSTGSWRWFLRRLIGFALGALAFASLAPPADPARSQAARPIRVIISVPPGGSIDLLVRVLADHISTSKGQSIIIESRPGAGGIIAAEAVARAPPDGNTLLINNNGMIISAILRKVNYDPQASFEPICYLVTTPQLIVVNSASPYRTLAELVDAARAKTPKETISQLIDWFSAALLAPEVKSKLTAQALYPDPKCGVDFDAHIRRQSDLYTRLIRELSIKTQ